MQGADGALRFLAQDFAALQLDEIQDSITVRRNRIFLLMEEARAARGALRVPLADSARRAYPQVRRLRIQQRVKTGDVSEEDITKQEFKSALPLLPPLVRSISRATPDACSPGVPACSHQTETSIKDYYIAWSILVLMLIAFGGYIAPMAEVKLGLGCAFVCLLPPLCLVLANGAAHVHRGTSYAEWVQSVGLPKQLSEARFAHASRALAHAARRSRVPARCAAGGPDCGVVHGRRRGRAVHASGGGGQQRKGTRLRATSLPARFPARADEARARVLADPRQGAVRVLQRYGVPAVRGVRHARQAGQPRGRALLLRHLQRHGQGHVHLLPLHRHGHGHGARPSHRPFCVKEGARGSSASARCVMCAVMMQYECANFKKNVRACVVRVTQLRAPPAHLAGWR